jgi:hypothetical protein
MGGLGSHLEEEPKSVHHGLKYFLSLAQKKAKSEIRSAKQKSLLGALRASSPERVTPLSSSLIIAEG